MWLRAECKFSAGLSSPPLATTSQPDCHDLDGDKDEEDDNLDDDDEEADDLDDDDDEDNDDIKRRPPFQRLCSRRTELMWGTSRT